MLTLGFGFIPRMPAAECIELACLGEDLGFDRCWLADQTFYYDPFSLLGAIGARTNRIGLGIAVTNPFSRHPVQLARAAQTLDRITEGRFTLGIGAGNRKELLDKLGMRQQRTAERTALAVNLIRQLLEGHKVTSDNPFFPVKDVALESPVPSSVPLLVGARGPLMLATAGEVGDGAIVECLLTPGSIAWAKQQLAKGGARRGMNVPDSDYQYVAWGVGFLVESYDGVPADIRQMVGHLIAVTPDNLIEPLNLDPEKTVQLKADYANVGPSAAGKYVGPEELSAVSFVGPVAALREKLALLYDSGVTHISFLLMGRSGEDNKHMLRSFAKHVFAFRNHLSPSANDIT